MPRVREVVMDGLKLCISPLTYDETEKFIKEGREMRDRDPKPTAEEWANRTLDSVVLALNKAANGNEAGRWTKQRLTAELDSVMINRIFEEFMEMSGLKLPEKQAPGEATATSTSL